MPVKNIVSKTWKTKRSSDGKYWSAWEAGDKPNLPYTLPTTANTSVLIGTNTAQDVRPASHSGSEFAQATFEAYGGGTLVEAYGTHGAYVIADPGGHTNPSFLDTLIFDFSAAAWSVKANTNGLTNSPATVTQAQTNGSPYYEISAASPGEFPSPGHLYASLIELRAVGASGSVMYVGRATVCTSPVQSMTAHKQDLDTGLWTRAVTGSAAHMGDEGSAAYDAVTGRYYKGRSDFWNATVIEYIRESDMTWQALSLSGSPPTGSQYSKMFIHPSRRVMLWACSTGLFGYDLTAADGTSNIVTLTTSGSIPSNGSNTWVYHPRFDAFYQWGDSSGSVLNKLKVSGGSGTGGTWAFTTITIGGAGIPPRTQPQNHYTCLQYVPAIDRLACFPGSSLQVAVIEAS